MKYIRPLLASAAFALLATAPPRMLAQTPTVVVVAPMAADADPAFEVATIRPTKPGDTHQQFNVSGRRVSFENQTVVRMLCFAYGIHNSQIIGAPAWFDTDPYDVDGVPDVEGHPSLRQLQQMTRKLLADRFGLKLHHEKRELSIYAVVIAKGGAKLTKSAPGSHSDETTNGNGGQMTMKFLGNTMEEFALEMQFQASRPVIDQTGLAGRYDFTIHWTSDESKLSEPNAPPGFFTAIEEQAGLKLEPKKDLADVLVIDHADRPSEN